MKYHGARDNYNPLILDRLRTSAKGDEAIWPFKFRNVVHVVTERSPAKKAFKKRPLHCRRKHGRTTATKRRVHA